MKLRVEPNWLSAEVQARIEPPPTPIASPKEFKERACNTIKVKRRRNPTSAGSETYEFKMTIFENGKPKRLLQLMMNLNKAIDKTGNMAVAGIIHFICITIHG